MILENYLEQHQNIKAQVGVVQGLAANDKVQENAFQLGTEISRLAGIIKIHLSSEDKFMYPELLKSENELVRAKAAEYQKEMGNLMAVFTEFKDKYNTKSRILEHEASFKVDFAAIVAALTKRIAREEQELYKNL